MVGRPKGSSAPRHLSMETKAKLQARRELREKEKELKKLEKKVFKARTNLADKKHVLKKVELAVDPKEQQSTNKNTVLTESEFEKAPKKVRDFIEENKESIVFKPNDGPQTDFLAAGEQDVLYGGAAGGGKSFAMLVDPLRFMNRSEHRALLLRRSMPELRELIDKSRELYTKAFPGAKFREVEKVWKFPSGATLEFGYLDRDADVYRYQGQSYSWIGIDELTQYPTEFPLQYLQSRLRTTDSEIKPYIRCTANPGGVGGHWVRKRYLTPAPPNEAFKGPDGLTRKFIPARLEDNPYLSKDGRYEQMLASLPPVQRKQLLEGNWDVAEGAAFVEFNPEIHVIPPFKIPIHWSKYKGVDYGYAAESCCVWSTIDPDDDTLIIIESFIEKVLQVQH